ncbi:MAG: sulfatase [Planctomycetota bacterium]
MNMMLKRMAQRLGSCLFLICCLASTFQSAVAIEKPAKLAAPNVTDGSPNVVIFFIDDLGQRDVQCYGSTNYSTPNMDRLASRGVRFTNFYSANPVCSPTRVALLTGKAPHRLGITQWLNQPNDLHLPLDEVIVGEAFAEQGYQTGYIGKWHVGEKDHQMPDKQGFRWMRCVNRAGAPGSYYFPFRRKSKKGHYSDVPDLDDRQQGDYLTDELTDHAIEFIQDNQDKPFLLCFAHYAVHTPMQGPPALVETYKKKFADLPQLDQAFFPERNGGKTRTRQDNPTYAAMVENLDMNVGRVLEQLETSGLTEKTIVVFTSDNGGLSTTARIGPTSCRPFRAGKGWTYEGGIRIPTMITWPKKIQPGVADSLGISMDLYPTLLELAGIAAKPNQHLDGISLVSAIEGKPSPTLKKRFLAWTYPHHHGSQHSPSNAIRDGDWKLIQKTDDATPDNERLELYRLSDDIGEANNLVKQNPDKANELLKKLTGWLDSTQPEK